MYFHSGVDPSQIGSSEISQIAQTWIKRYEKMNLEEDGAAFIPDESTFWSFSVISDLVRHCPEKAFLVIDEVLRLSDNDAVLCNLTAGPLEELLAKYGDAVMPQIEPRVKNSRKFRDLFSWMYPVGSEAFWNQIVTLVTSACDDGE